MLPLDSPVNRIIFSCSLGSPTICTMICRVFRSCAMSASSAERRVLDLVLLSSAFKYSMSRLTEIFLGLHAFGVGRVQEQRSQVRTVVHHLDDVVLVADPTRDLAATAMATGSNPLRSTRKSARTGVISYATG
jgi:hypothetical protein